MCSCYILDAYAYNLGVQTETNICLAAKLPKNSFFCKLVLIVSVSVTF